MSAQQVIDESRPMLVDVLRDIGLHTSDQPLDLRALLDPFSHWVETQDVRQEDTAFLAGLIGAFICEFLMEHHSTTRVVRDSRIFLQMPVQSGVWREFDPYEVALGMAQSHGSVTLFLKKLTES
jgi:hypothetical protein